MNWADLKTTISELAPQAMSGMVDSAGLKSYARMTHNTIATHPYKCSFLFKEGSIALSGAASYDLKTLLPDLNLVYLAKTTDGRTPYQSPSAHYSKDLGMTTMTVMNNIIRFNNPPASGTLTIPYYTKWLVIDGTTGESKADFEADGDYSIVPDNVLVEGIMRFVWRKEHKKAYTIPMVLPDGRITELDPFTYELQNMIIADSPIAIAFTDFRFIS